MHEHKASPGRDIPCDCQERSMIRKIAAVVSNSRQLRIPEVTTAINNRYSFTVYCIQHHPQSIVSFLSNPVAAHLTVSGGFTIVPLSSSLLHLQPCRVFLNIHDTGQLRTFLPSLATKNPYMYLLKSPWCKRSLALTRKPRRGFTELGAGGCIFTFPQMPGMITSSGNT